MTPRDWFVVGTRLLGIWMLLEFVGEAVFFAEGQWGLVTLRTSLPSAYVLHGGVDLILGLAMVLCAPIFADWLDWHSPRKPKHACPECGYDLRAGHDKCPECGYAEQATETSNLSVGDQ